MKKAFFGKKVVSDLKGEVENINDRVVRFLVQDLEKINNIQNENDFNDYVDKIFKSFVSLKD